MRVEVIETLLEVESTPKDVSGNAQLGPRTHPMHGRATGRLTTRLLSSGLSLQRRTCACITVGPGVAPDLLTPQWADDSA